MGSRAWCVHAQTGRCSSVIRSAGMQLALCLMTASDRRTLDGPDVSYRAASRRHAGRPGRGATQLSGLDGLIAVLDFGFAAIAPKKEEPDRHKGGQDEYHEEPKTLHLFSADRWFAR